MAHQRQLTTSKARCVQACRWRVAQEETFYTQESAPTPNPKTPYHDVNELGDRVRAQLCNPLDETEEIIFCN